MSSASSTPQISTRPTQYDILLAQLIRSPGIAASVCRELEFVHLKEHGAPLASVVMYGVIKKFFKQHNSAPDVAVLEVEVLKYADEKRVDAATRAALAAHIEMFKSLYPRVDARSEAPVRSLVRDIIQSRIIKPQVAALAQGYADGGSVQDLSQRIKELEAKQLSIEGGRRLTNVVSRVVEDTGQRITTGLPWIDSYLGQGRGPVLGCVLGILAPQGAAKCLAPETRIRMFDGSVRRADSVVVGDLLMGPDSRPRKVLSVCRGRDRMFEIRPRWFEPFTCNSVHVLTLQSVDTHAIIDIPLNEYLAKNAWFKARHKLIRAAVEYPEQALAVDPYLIGAWLGDGKKRNGDPIIYKNDRELLDYCVSEAARHGIQATITVDRRTGCHAVSMTSQRFVNSKDGNPLRNAFRECITSDGDKHIPRKYMLSSRAQRLRLLAGLIDTDGTRDGSGCTIVTKYPALRDNIVELSLSLGFMASKSEMSVAGSVYWRIYIAAAAEEIPLKIHRKRPAKVTERKYRGNRSRFDVVALGEGDYAGFTLDGDGRFLLEDFTVTHNTGTGIQMVVAQAMQGRPALLVLAEEGYTKNIQRRIWACITKARIPDIEACKDNLEEVIKKNGLDAAAIAKKMAAVDENLQVLDLMAHEGDVDAIVAEVDQMEQEGRKPVYTYVDWAGPLADRMLSRGGDGGRKYEKKYDALKDLAFQLAQLAGRKNIIIAISHQMAAESVSKGPFASNDQYCAAECKAFTEQFKYVLVINKKDPATGLQLMNIAKARDDQNNVKVVLRFDGATSTTTDVSSDFEPRGKRFVTKNKKIDELPVEKPPSV